MDIITATKIIQEQADSNGNSFDDEFWNIANNLTSCPKDVYAAWRVFHDATNEYFRRGADKVRIEQMARDVKKLNADQQAIFDSI
jgi:hypothetical protein